MLSGALCALLTAQHWIDLETQVEQHKPSLHPTALKEIDSKTTAPHQPSSCHRACTSASLAGRGCSPWHTWPASGLHDRVLKCIQYARLVEQAVLTTITNSLAATGNHPCCFFPACQRLACMGWRQPSWLQDTHRLLPSSNSAHFNRASEWH